MNITINPAFRDLIPPLHPSELEQLESNILRDGCRDPIVLWGHAIVDGHNRYDICTRNKVHFETTALDLESEADAKAWIIRNQFGRRNLAPYTRAELALQLEEIISAKAKEKQVRKPESVSANLPEQKPIETREELAKLAGVSGRTMQDAKLVATHADEETKQKLRKNEVSIHRVAKDIKETKQREQRQEKRKEAAKDSPKEDHRIIVGDFRESADAIPNGSVSLIFTDPPYDRDASKMLPALADFAAAKLADGGSLVLYVGQTQIPSALDALRKTLRYWWTIACIHKGGATVMREYGINAGWKAVLWFVKGTRDNNSEFVSDVMSGGQEKTHHDWQQSESEASYWIERLCPDDGIVCDPFLGGGTTAAAAQKLKRQWIGFEINPDNAAIAAGRVA